VERALALLERLADEREPTGVLDLARKSGVDKSAVQRTLNALESRGWVRKNARTSKYSLGVRAVALAHKGLQAVDFLEVAAPIAKHLAQTTKETAFIGVQDDDRVVFVYKVPGLYAVRFEEQVGTSVDLHTTSIGKAILAALDDQHIEEVLSRTRLSARTEFTITSPEALKTEISAVRARGCAFSDEEHFLDVLGVGAVIRGASGSPLGGIGVIGPKMRMNELREQIARRVVEAAAAASREMGFGSKEP
jgi:DNA-binding IclR family transcriptional regulator